MRLGKTLSSDPTCDHMPAPRMQPSVLQTIAFLAHLKFDLGVPGPHLVVAPLSVLSSWMTEIKRFCPELRAVKLHSSDVEERKRLITSLSEGDDYDVVVGICIHI